MPFPLRFPREMECFLQAAQLLGTIQGDPGRVGPVLELQKLLLRRIARSELSHSRLQDARLRLKQRLVRERLIGEKARETRDLVLKIQERCDALEQLRFLYRCFGDGIAATYQAPLRHRYFYFAQKAHAKERSGLLARKDSFRSRYRALKLGIGMGIPVLLADVTNMLGQGDLCVLAGGEPQPLDLKSFMHRGPAGRLQQEALRRTIALLARQGTTSVPEGSAHDKAHKAHLNDCVRQAMESGIAQASPEPGLRYVVVRNDHYRSHPDCLQVLHKRVPKSTMSVQVTPETAWIPMQPFTLSMSAGHAVLFMQGVFQLLVYVDMKVLVSHFASLGIHAVALMDGVTALQLSNDVEDLEHGVYRVSEALFQRIPCEFMSLRSFAQEMAGLLEPAQAHSDQGQLFAPPGDWGEARHYYEDEGQALH